MSKISCKRRYTSHLFKHLLVSQVPFVVIFQALFTVHSFQLEDVISDKLQCALALQFTDLQGWQPIHSECFCLSGITMHAMFFSLQVDQLWKFRGMR